MTPAGVCEFISPPPHTATLCGCGEIGIRIRFRILRREACRFDPCHPHQKERAPSWRPLFLVQAIGWRTATEFSSLRGTYFRGGKLVLLMLIEGAFLCAQSAVEDCKKHSWSTLCVRFAGSTPKGRPRKAPSIKQILTCRKIKRSTDSFVRTPFHTPCPARYSVLHLFCTVGR